MGTIALLFDVKWSISNGKMGLQCPLWDYDLHKLSILVPSSLTSHHLQAKLISPLCSYGRVLIMSPISPLLNVNGSICGCPQVPASRRTWCCHACSSLAKGSCPWEFSLTKGCPWGFSSAGTWQLTSSVSRHPRQRWRRKKKVEVEATFRTKLPSSDGNYQMLYSASYFFGN